MKYVIIATENQRKKWWESDCLPKSLKTKSFDSFEEAKNVSEKLSLQRWRKARTSKLKTVGIRD